MFNILIVDAEMNDRNVMIDGGEKIDLGIISEQGGRE